MVATDREKVTAPGKSATPLAYGDLDCDGTYSTFSVTGTIGPDGATSLEPVLRDHPLE